MPGPQPSPSTTPTVPIHAGACFCIDWPLSWTRIWSMCAGSAMQLRQASSEDRVAEWLRGIHQKRCGTSPQNAQIPGNDCCGQPPRRLPWRDWHIAVPPGPGLGVSTKRNVSGLHREIRRNTFGAFAQPHRALRIEWACSAFGQCVSLAPPRNAPSRQRGDVWSWLLRPRRRRQEGN